MEYKTLTLFLTVLAYAAGALIYDNEFDSADSTADWVIEVTGNPHNNELQYYTAREQNIYVENGNLVIKPIKEMYQGRKYTSGRLHSQFAMKYGRVQVRAKLPNGNGLWPAIWMMPRDDVFGTWPKSGEIDICEARGDNMAEIQSTIHFGDLPCCDYHYYENSGDLDIDGSIDQYHVYQLDWTPTELVYSLDGKPYHMHNLDRQVGWMYGNKGDPFNQYFYIILNVAVGGHYVTDPTPTTTWNYPDAEMKVDYVRAYPLEDISTFKCGVKPTASYGDICGNVEWACYNQLEADVSAQCTSELLNCCATRSCEITRVQTLATEVFAAYDEQINDGDSCNFGGTAMRKYVLHDGYAPNPECRIKDDANNADICGSMLWACSSDNTYANVDPECSDAADVQACCNVDPYSCDNNRLRQGAGAVFAAYYNAIPSASSCDFGGVCYLDAIQEPIHAIDGYGA
ncbi:glucan endo-1,3-beta-glucosidase-like [Styela clava]